MNTSGKALVALYLHRKGEQVFICTGYNTEYNCQYIYIANTCNVLMINPTPFSGWCSKWSRTRRTRRRRAWSRAASTISETWKASSRPLSYSPCTKLEASESLFDYCFLFSQGMVGLSKALRVFEDEGLNLVHIESRKVKGSKDKVQHHRLYSSVFPSLPR